VIEAVAVDLGAVLFSEGTSVALNKVATQYGYDRRPVGAILASPQNILSRRCLIPDGESWAWVQQQLPSNSDYRLIKNQWYNGYIFDQDIYGIIANLRKNYSFIAFSGNPESGSAYLEGKYRFRHLRVILTTTSVAS